MGERDGSHVHIVKTPQLTQTHINSLPVRWHLALHFAKEKMERQEKV